MFNLFKIKVDKKIYAPVSGKCIDMTEVNDIGFASLSMGDGIAIIPTSQTITAPCDGTIQMIFRTGHAFGIKADNGLEILIHIGIDTVNLKGQGFQILKEVNQKVKKGDPIIKLDLEKIDKIYDLTTILVITNGKPIQKLSVGKEVHVGESVLERIE